MPTANFVHTMIHARSWAPAKRFRVCKFVRGFTFLFIIILGH
jgi:hypothetical protein